MNKRYKVMLCALLQQNIFAISAVTYTFSGGRFGDNLIAYSHAKWLSYKHKIPLLYKYFPYSDHLELSSLEEHYDEAKARRFKKILVLKDRNFKIDPSANILYVVPYFAESEYDLTDPNYPPLFSVNWNNSEFISILKKYIKPKLFTSSNHTPEGYISVAMHMRKGTGHDCAMLPINCPHKSCPDSYYVEQLKKLSDYFSTEKLYIHLFTDHDDPLALIAYFKKHVPVNNITYACREVDNRHNKNVVEDFFSLTTFDCLLRSDSNFSLMAAKFGNYLVHIHPKHYVKNGREVIVDQVQWDVK